MGIKVGTLGGDGKMESLKTVSLCLPTTGRQCELLSPCTPNPCEHGGYCESAPGQLAVCSCPPGWQGTSAASSSSSPSSPLQPAPYWVMLGTQRGSHSWPCLLGELPSGKKHS